MQVQLKQYTPYWDVINSVYGYPTKPYPAGCVAVAMAQIVVHHGKPFKPSAVITPFSPNTVGSLTSFPDPYTGVTRYFSSLLSYKWGLYKLIPDAYYLSNEDKATIGVMMLDIGARVNMEYGKTINGHYGSYAYSTNVPAAFVSMGYKNSTYQGYNYNDIVASVAQNMPVYVDGFSSDYEARHAYVIDNVCMSYDHYTNTNGISYIPLVHCNVGWGGGSDGWYYSDLFSLQPDPDTVYEFTYDMNMIPFIERNEDNNVNPVQSAIDTLIQNERARIGPNAGKTISTALYLSLANTGINLLYDQSMDILFNAIKNDYVHLDFTGVGGNIFPHYPSSVSVSKAKILSVTLDVSVKKIEGGTTALDPTRAFSGFTGLQSISAPGVHTFVGSYPFDGCPNLKSIILPNYGSFSEIPLYQLEHLALGVYGIDYMLFYDCDNLKSVNFPNAGGISLWAFADCNNLEEAHFPNANIIGDYAFYNCNSLKEIEFPVATTISSKAFSNCVGLKEAEFPWVTTINTSAFSNTGIMSIVLPEYTSTANLPPLPQLKHLTLGLSSIGQSEFYGYTTLVSVEFPKAQSIGSGAFAYCTSLERAEFREAESIGNYAFASCISLESVNCPEVTYIEFSAFNYCPNLESVEFPLALTIESNTFENCYSLESIEFPLATSIGSSAFYNCISLKRAEIPEASTLDYAAFYGCPSLEEIHLNYIPPTLGGYVFLGGTSSDFTIRAQAGSYSTSYLTWVLDTSNFHGSGANIVFDFY